MELYQHQIDVLKKTKDKNKVAYYLDMGLGKTFVGSEKLNDLGCRVNLLVCQKSKIKEWLLHFLTYYQSYRVRVLNNNIKNFMEDTHNKILGIINYDLIFRREELLKLRNFTLMLDESSMIQNDKTKRTKYLFKMKPSNVILLSGTPSSGKYENLWSQARLLGWNINKTEYNNKYVNWKNLKVGNLTIKIVDKNNPYKNVDELKKNLKENGAIFMKTEECFKLPKQNINHIEVENTKQYLEFTRTKVIKIGNKELVGDTELTYRLYLRQLCGHYNKNKLQAFEDLIYSTKDRLIVFYNFTEELNVLKKIAKEKPISIVNGEIKDLKSYETEDNSITFVQYQAGSMGLNLQKSNKIIYFTLPDSSELFEQSIKRIHRIGQTKTCFYYLLLVKYSIENYILKTLNIRKDYLNELFKDS